MNTVKPHGVCRKSGLTRSLTTKDNLCPKRDYVRKHGVFQEANVELIVARDPISNPSLFYLWFDSWISNYTGRGYTVKCLTKAPL